MNFRSINHLIPSRRNYQALTTRTLPIYLSTSLDPYFNLSYEEFLFRNSDPSVPKLLIYRNSKSVIIGRNQNPWIESNVTRLRKHDFPVIRRRSGGGTVYHDEGNTNYSIMIPRSKFDRQTTSRILLNALIELKVPDIRLNERFDLCLGTHKVSGSAYKVTRDRAYHHGTMLINSDLSNLHDYLNPKKSRMVSRATESVRSPVTNLGIDHETFTQSLMANFLNTYHPQLSGHPHTPFIVNQDEFLNNGFIQDGIKELRSWEWTFGQTPDFSNTILVEINSLDGDGEPQGFDVQLNIHKGKIGSIIIPSPTSLPKPFDIQPKVTIDRLSSMLVGHQYGDLILSQEQESNTPEDQFFNRVVNAIQKQIT